MSIAADEGTAAHTVLEQCLRFRYEMGLEASPFDFVDERIKVEDGPHAPLSPSGAKRWMTCPAAPTLEARFPEPACGPREIVFTADYADAVDVCLDYVNDRVNQLRKEWGSCQVLPERRVSPGIHLTWTDVCDGTSDIALIAGNAEASFIEHIDFKAGAGVPVSEFDPQNEFYLLGTLAGLDPTIALPKAARVTIVQPRCFKVEPRIRSRDIEDVRSWMAEFSGRAIKAIRATEDPNAAPVPSEDGCRFCSARGACDAFQRYALQQAGALGFDEEITDLDAVAYAARDTRELTGQKIRIILDARELLQGALQAVEAFALFLLTEGIAPREVAENYKLVRGRSSRRWAGEDPEIERGLKKIKVTDPDSGKTRGLGKKDLYIERLKGIPDVERLLKGFQVPPKDARWDALNRLIEKPEGKLTIAPMADPRPAIEVNGRGVDPTEAFGTIESEPPPLDA